MSPDTPPTSSSGTPRPVRARLARVAQNGATLAPGVAGLTDGGERWSTPVPDADPIAGVQVTAAGEGGYAVEVHLIAHPVPLADLAAQIRSRIVEAVAELGLLDELARVDVYVDGLVAEGEVGA